LNKVSNLLAITAHPSTWHIETADPNWHSTYLGIARVAEMNNLLCAIGPLALGILSIVSSRSRSRLRAFRPLMLFLLTASGAWVLILFGNTPSTAIIAEGPYAVVVVAMVLFALMATMLPRSVAVATIGLGVVWFIVEWVPGFGFTDAEPSLARAPVDLAMLSVCLAAAVLVCLASSWILRIKVNSSTCAARARSVSGASLRSQHRSRPW
jgi:hypothetical protein